MFSISFISCYGEKKDMKEEKVTNLCVETIKQRFRPILNNFIERLKKEKYKTNVIAVICYSIFDKEIILLVDNIGYDSSFLRGYTDYKDYLICYYGVEDFVVEKILNLDNLDQNIPNKKYINLKNIEDVIFFEPIEGYYIIDNNGYIIPYDPSNEIKKELRILNVKNGLSHPIPPMLK